MSTYYIARTQQPGYWGRGSTEAVALSQCRKAGASKSEAVNVYRVDCEAENPKPFVNDIGSILYYGTLFLIAEYKHGKRKGITAKQTNAIHRLQAGTSEPSFD